MNDNNLAWDYVDTHRARGHHIDDRIERLLREGGRVEAYTLETEDEFLNLLFHVNPACMMLTPYHESRRLRDIVDRMATASMSFDSLCQESSWFAECRRIQVEGFDRTRYGSHFLMDLVDEERAWSPNASFSIYDGTHRALVYAFLLMTKEVSYERIQSFIFRSRPWNA